MGTWWLEGQLQCNWNRVLVGLPRVALPLPVSGTEGGGRHFPGETCGERESLSKLVVSSGNAIQGQEGRLCHFLSTMA